LKPSEGKGALCALDRPTVSMRRGKDGPDASRVKDLNGSIDPVAFAPQAHIHYH
jgi:hypothetical protein